MATCEEYIVRGNLIYTESMEKFSALSDGGMVVRDGRIQSAGPYGEVADRGLPVLDYRDKLIIPGFVDLHVHAAQYHQIGMGMDETLIRWLEKYTFAEEERFADPEQAAVLYADFIRELVYSGTTRAAVFATTHPVATDILCRLLKKAGVGAFVGKVNMDANAPVELQEETKTSLEQTRQAVAAGTLKPEAPAAQPEAPRQTPAEPEPQPEKSAQPERPVLPPLPMPVANTVRSLHARWAAEEAAMRRSQPGFDLKAELKNPEMRRLMQLPGMRVQDAYRLAHYEDTLRTTAQTVEQGVVERVQQRAARPLENGLRPGAAASVRPDVAAMTRAQREALERRVLHGAQIEL